MTTVVLSFFEQDLVPGCRKMEHLVYIYMYATPPPVPRFGSVYTVNANRNNHFWVLILIHGLRLPS